MHLFKTPTARHYILGLLLTVSAAQLQAQPTPPSGPYSSDTTANNPKVEGTGFEMPQAEEPKVTRKELMKQVAVDILQVLLTPRDKKPKQRLRGEVVAPAICTNFTGYKGKCMFYQFTNSDFPNTNNSCGQAAMASALWAVGLNKNFSSQKELANSIWGYAPPKITLGNMLPIEGTLGTDWRQFNYGMDGYKKLYGVQYAWVEGVSEIKKYLAMELPVVIMLDTGTLPQFKYKWYTGHWVTAFAYDKDYIYVTNFPQNRMTWSQLDDAFRKGNLAVGHGTSNRAAVVWK